MNDQDFIRLLELSKDDLRCLLINDRFLCRSADGGKISFAEVQDERSFGSRDTWKADVVGYDQEDSKELVGQIDIFRDNDLNGLMSGMLFFNTDPNKQSFGNGVTLVKCIPMPDTI